MSEPRIFGERDYKVIEDDARDHLILDILKRIDSDTQRVGAVERRQVWDKGWQDALDAFRENPVEASLIPKFIR